MVNVEAGHPTPEDLAAYVSGALAGSEQANMERHLTACDACRQELIEASVISSRRGSRRWVVVALPTAAAAVLAALLLVPSSTPPPPSGSAPQLRGEEAEGTPAFSVVEPAPEATVSPGGLVFRWHSAGEDSYYRITVTDEGGDLVWTATSTDTVVVLPGTVTLERGRTYFWYVDGLLPGARSSSTGIQEFVTER